MLRVCLIRHSMTLGNLKKRYIGFTDEPLCDEGIQLLRKSSFPDVDRIYVSPLLRCIQTAEIIYPNQKLVINDELKECDFGEFENRNYQELSENKKYQDWIDSGGKDAFPGGEHPEHFKERCIKAFKEIITESTEQNLLSIAIIAHGGTIMSIMEALVLPKKEYYSWHVDNAKGYMVEVDQTNWKIYIKECI